MMRWQTCRRGRLLLSDTKNHVGFSFALSETPPPARTDAGSTPLGDLDLDLRDFGETTDEEFESSDLRSRSWAGDPSPATPESERFEAPSEELENRSESAPLQGSAEATEEAGSSPGKTTDQASVQPAPTCEPRIKKIQFPPLAKKRAANKPEPSRPRTHFSSSISAESPRARLESDSDERGAAQAKPTSPPESLAPPEDLPAPDAPLVPDTAGWNADTPTAKEIWRRARISWQTTSRQALVLGGQGLKAGQKLAVVVNEKVRDTLRQAAEARRSAGDLAPESQPSDPAQSAESVISTPAGPRHGAPSMAGRVILGLARTTGKKLAAPLSAVAAATLVYFAGTHLLGTEGTVALSKAVQGPQVPELGTLESDKTVQRAGGDATAGPSTKEAAAKSDASSAPSKSDPPAMQTEVTDMPEGLSWPGKGLIEVVTSEEELIYVDGVFTGRGPLRRIPVTPGKHEVSIRTENSERKGTVEVTANRNTRAVFKR